MTPSVPARSSGHAHSDIAAPRPAAAAPVASPARVPAPVPDSAQRTGRRAAIAAGAIGLLAALSGCTPDDPGPTYKPVVYLDAPEETRLRVRLDYDGELATCYPEPERDPQGATWDVSVRPGGELIGPTGRSYPSLFWDGLNPGPMGQTTGTVVEAEDAIAFLEELTEAAGLTDREAAELITFWGPILRERGRSLVTVATEQQEAIARYTLSTPEGGEVQPDTVIRLYLVVGPVPETPVPVQPLPAAPGPRTGLTLVEWGGTIAGAQAE